MKKVHEIIISAEDKPNDNDYQYLIRVNGELEVCQDVKKDTLKICLVKGIYLTEDQEYTLCSLIENILLLISFILSSTKHFILFSSS